MLTFLYVECGFAIGLMKGTEKAFVLRKVVFIREMFRFDLEVVLAVAGCAKNRTRLSVQLDQCLCVL